MQAVDSVAVTDPRKVTGTMTTKNKQRAVVICTAKRGVFFGYTPDSNDTIIKRGTVTLARARMCTYWSAATKGVTGLAVIGPQSGSKIGAQVSDITCESVTGIFGCSEQAVKAWEEGRWS